MQQLNLTIDGLSQHTGTLNAAADALRARVEATALERDTAALSALTTSNDIRTLRREHAATLERNVTLQARCEAAEAEIARLHSDAEVLANAAKSRAAQAAKLIKEKNRLLTVVAEARAFVHAHGIAVGGARFRRELTEFLTVNDAGASAAPAGAVAEAASRARARSRSRGNGHGSDDNVSDDSGDDRDDDGDHGSTPSSARPWHGPDSARSARERVGSPGSGVVKPLVTALEAAAATAARAAAPVESAAAGEPRARAWSAKAQIKAQQEYIARLEATVAQCKDRVRELTNRFRAAAGEREKVRIDVHRSV
jgi:cell division protein FtsB